MRVVPLNFDVVSVLLMFVHVKVPFLIGDSVGSNVHFNHGSGSGMGVILPISMILWFGNIWKGC